MKHVLVAVIAHVVDQKVAREREQCRPGSVRRTDEHHDDVCSLPREVTESCVVFELIPGVGTDEEEHLHAFGYANGLTAVRLRLFLRSLLRRLFSDGIVPVDGHPVDVSPGRHGKDCSHNEEQPKSDRAANDQSFFHRLAYRYPESPILRHQPLDESGDCSRLVVHILGKSEK